MGSFSVAFISAPGSALTTSGVSADAGAGVLRDELLAHRLGLIPIKADPTRFNWPSKETKKADHDTPLNEKEVLKFKLHVRPIF